MTTSTNLPWYKQFWPWFLITVPIITLIVCALLITAAVSTQDSLVVDDYYKAGKTINQQFEKVERARFLAIQTNLQIDDHSVLIDFVRSRPSTGEALKLDFHHTTLAKKDFEVLLTQDAKGNFRGNIDRDITGKWRITLSPLDQEWKITHTLSFPRAGIIPFNP